MANWTRRDSPNLIRRSYTLIKENDSHWPEQMPMFMNDPFCMKRWVRFTTERTWNLTENNDIFRVDSENEKWLITQSM